MSVRCNIGKGFTKGFEIFRDFKVFKYTIVLVVDNPLTVHWLGILVAYDI